MNLLKFDKEPFVQIEGGVGGGVPLANNFIYVKTLLYELGFTESWNNDNISYVTPNIIKQRHRK